MSRRLKAPSANGEILADPSTPELPRLVDQNRQRLDAAVIRIDGLSLRELRTLARQELDIPDGPVVLTGHQPELFHPGVWVKNFALHGLAKRIGGTPVNLIADSDTMKSATIRLPTWTDWTPENVRLEPIAFDIFDGEVPYEQRAIRDAVLFASFPERVAEAVRGWGYEPLFATGMPFDGTPADRFTSLRVRTEQAWGCNNCEVRVSKLAQTAAFRHFVRHIVAQAPRFRADYNAALKAYRTANRLRSRNHPAPDLDDDELPFWIMTKSGRGKFSVSSTVAPSELRPRALTLTLFARLCLGDFFIHGIGGGKYDEVTDDIIRRFFGFEPPAYQVLSATLHLPLPAFAATSDDVRRLERQARDLHWNPHRHLPRDVVGDLADEHHRLETELQAGPFRTARFQHFRRISDRLRPKTAEQSRINERSLHRARTEAAANAILRRRDYSWVLYPENVLKPFLQRFLAA